MRSILALFVFLSATIPNVALADDDSIPSVVVKVSNRTLLRCMLATRRLSGAQQQEENKSEMGLSTSTSPHQDWVTELY